MFSGASAAGLLEEGNKMLKKQELLKICEKITDNQMVYHKDLPKDEQEIKRKEISSWAWQTLCQLDLLGYSIIKKK